MRLKFSNCVYDGQILNGLFHGVGKIIFDNGDSYVGQFENNKYHGYGEYHFVNGDYYKGTWKNGIKHGKGFEKSKEGTYIGNFENGKRHGSGCLKMTSGIVVFGNWHNGLHYGDNTFYYPNGHSIWRKYNTPGGDITDCLYNDNYDKSKLEKSVSLAYTEVNSTNKHLITQTQQGLQAVFKSENEKPLDTSKISHDQQTNKTNQRLENTEKTKIEDISDESMANVNALIDEANKLYEQKDYIKASSLYQTAEKLSTDLETINLCHICATISDAMFYTTIGEFATAKKLLLLAKKLSSNKSLIENIDNQISEIDNFVENQEISELFEKAVNCLNNEEEFEKAIELFKLIKQKTNDKEIIALCDENINCALHNIKLRKNSERTKKEYLDAVACYNQGNYKLAIQHFKTAKDLSDDFDFKRTCEKDIKDCESAIESEQENKAIDYYNDGVWYYNNGDYEKAKWKFEDAYETSSNREFREKCLQSIEDCKEFLA